MKTNFKQFSTSVNDTKFYAHTAKKVLKALEGTDISDVVIFEDCEIIKVPAHAEKIASGVWALQN